MVTLAAWWRRDVVMRFIENARSQASYPFRLTTEGINPRRAHRKSYELRRERRKVRSSFCSVQSEFVLQDGYANSDIER